MSAESFELRRLHIAELQTTNRVLIYGIFVLTFAFYAAYAGNDKFFEKVGNFSCVLVTVSFVGNALWMLLSYPCVRHMLRLSDAWASATQPPTQIDTKGLERFYLGSSLGLIGFNYVGFVAVIWATQDRLC